MGRVLTAQGILQGIVALLVLLVTLGMIAKLTAILPLHVMPMEHVMLLVCVNASQIISTLKTVQNTATMTKLAVATDSVVKMEFVSVLLATPAILVYQIQQPQLPQLQPQLQLPQIQQLQLQLQLQLQPQLQLQLQPQLQPQLQLQLQPQLQLLRLLQLQLLQLVHQRIVKVNQG